MEGNRVYLAACPDYGQAEAKLREAVAALGGMERFVRPGERSCSRPTCSGPRRRRAPSAPTRRWLLRRRSWWRRRGARR
ncbi:MAG: hypothetical protein ACLUES_19290 [Flavonifractor plautii]